MRVREICKLRLCGSIIACCIVQDAPKDLLQDVALAFVGGGLDCGLLIPPVIRIRTIT